MENGTIRDRNSKRNILIPGERNPSKLENSFQGCTTGRTFLHRYYSFPNRRKGWKNL